MSQIGSTGATVGTSIIPWNRTPGKPGTGTGNSVFSSHRWPSNKNATNAGTDVQREVHADEHIDKASTNDSESMMWPPLFDSQRITDAGSSESPNQVSNLWSVPSFSSLTSSNTLISPADCANPPGSGTWSSHSTSSDSCIPRAITGQQQFNHSSASNDTDLTRRLLVGQDDTSHLSIALSKMNVSNASSTPFQSIHEFAEAPVAPPGKLTSDSTYESKERAKSNTESAELESLFPLDPEEAIRGMVNTTEAWGVRPVDQSIPWDTSELLGESNLSPPASDVNPNGGRLPGGAHSNSLFDGSTMPQQSRRLSGLGVGTRDLESNVWPSEPPTGTGIWESHYENLGERTARWQQSTEVNPGSASFPNSHPGLMAGSGLPHSRGPLHDTTSGNSFRGYMRPNMGPLLGNTGVSKHMGNASFHGAPSPPGSSRGFPLTAGSGPWPFPPGPAATDSLMGGKGRWPNANFNRMPGKHQPPVTHLVSSQGGNGLRWPAMNNASHVPSGWPLADPRRPPNMLPGNWNNSASGDQPNYFGTSHPVLPPVSRMCQPGSEFATSPLLGPTPAVRGGPGGGAGGACGGPAPNQAFRLSHSAFYPSVAQRAFLSPQQHSQQLQQQSVLRANAMRQLIQLGFPDDEVQAIFSDINTNVERALIDLRDRTCHPGLDEIIRSFANSGLMSLTGQDENIPADFSRTDGLMTGNPGSIGVRPLAMRPCQQPPVFDQSLSKLGGLGNENLDLSIHILQQRETQILQTIMQLQSKHQELNQRLAQIRSANLPFATNPVMQELQLQAIQVASQIDAQHAQLKQIRSQAGMLKQLAAAAAAASSTSTSALTPQGNLSLSSPSNTSAFAPPSLATGMWYAHTPVPTSVVMCSGPAGQAPPQSQHQQHSSQLHENPVDQTAADAHESGLKLGSGSLMWETGPWSGSGQRSNTSFDPYTPPSVDRRWSSTTLPNRPPYVGALGDPRWSELDNNNNSNNNNLVSGALLTTSDPDVASDDGLGSRRVPSRSWLLAHSIPPHMSVSILKMAVSTALMKHGKPVGSGEKPTESQQPDFELHPNMSARWVLIGLASPTDASVVQDYLESSGADQNGAHYGSIKPVSPSEALLRLQDIQSLASRFKAFTSADGSSGRTVTQTSGMATFGASVQSAGGSADFNAPDTINRTVGEPI